jgi:hypothetical protein
MAQQHEHPKLCIQRLLSSFERSVPPSQIAARVAEARIKGVADPVTATLSLPLCAMSSGPDRALAVLCVASLLDKACRTSGVSRQPDAEELKVWAQQIVGGPNWSSLPLASLIDFARLLATGGYKLYDRLTLSYVGECLREYALEWRTRYKAEEDALFEELRKAEAEQRAVQARAEYEAMMADPERRAAYEQAKAELERFMGHHEQADRQRIRLDPKQRERIARDFANPTGE